MTLRKWLNNKGLESACEEMKVLAEPLEDDEGIDSVEANDYGDDIQFIIYLKDGSYVSQEISVYDEDEIEDGFDTEALFKQFAEYLCSNTYDVINTDFLNCHQKQFIIYLDKYWQL